MAEKQIRVAQLIGKTFNGGVGVCILNYYRRMDLNKVQFDFFVEDSAELVDIDEIHRLGGNIISIPSYKNLPRYLHTMKKLFEKGNYDIVHANLNSLNVFALYAAKRAKIPVRISHSHSTANKKEWKQTIVKNMLRPFSRLFATHYFACSEWAGRWLFGNRTFDKGEVTVLQNAIDLQRFSFDEQERKKIRRELGVKDRLVIGHIGRFMAQKNHTFLLEIFSAVRRKNPNALLLSVGNGPLFAEIQKKARDMGLEKDILFLGVQQNPEHFYNAMDCFVLPSLYEGLGIVLIEAQANGLASVVSTEVPRAVQFSNQISFLSLKDPADEWADAVLHAVNTPRADATDALRSGGYDINRAAEHLQTLYGSFIKAFN